MNEIISFSGRNFFLSNFYPQIMQFYYLNRVWIADSMEHAFQACKATNENDVKLVLSQPTPGKARHIGKNIKLRKDWDDVKDRVMYELLRNKFGFPSLREKLINTDPMQLIEGNDWHDNYWGACDCQRCAREKKHNMLGNLLMKHRSDLIIEFRKTKTKRKAK